MQYTEGIGWHSTPIEGKPKRPWVRFAAGKSKAIPLKGNAGKNPAFIRVPR